MATKRATETTGTIIAAIYCRISDARGDDTAGVDRQEADSRALAAARGWTVGRLFVDNDVSAYAAKRRPAYEEMLEAIERGEINAIVVQSAERLYRRMTDLEILSSLLTRKGVAVGTVKSGDVDLTTADGRMHAGLLGVVAKHESEKRGERVSRAAEDRAAAGRFGGGTRRFGYNAKMTELVPAEADLVREAYATIIAGGSLRSICKAWRDSGVTGSAGATMSPNGIKGLLLRPVNAGHGQHLGTLMPGISLAPRLVEPEVWEQARAILLDPARRSSVGPPVVTLLSGLLRCGQCGGVIRAGGVSGGSPGKPSYRCFIRGCIVRHRDSMDAFVIDAVVARVEASRATLSAAISETVPAPDVAPATAEAARIRRQLEGMADVLAAGDIDPADYATGTRKLRERLAVAEAEISAVVGRTSRLSSMLGAGDFRIAFDAAPIDTRRSVLREIIDHVTVSRGKASGWRPNVSSVEIVWKLA